MPAWHGDLQNRPAALDEAREAAELADARARQAADHGQARRARRAWSRSSRRHAAPGPRQAPPTDGQRWCVCRMQLRGL